MFMGDFLQFPPITDTPLYFINIQLKKEFTFTKSTQKKVISKKPLGNNSLNTKRCVFRVLGLNPKL
jgi:hypothetical protein